MNITLILFLIGIIGFILNRKNIISHARKFWTSESYNSVDLIGPAFKLLSEGFFILTLTFLLSRFIVSEFFGRDDSVSSFTGKLIIKYNTIKSFTDAITIGFKSRVINKCVLCPKFNNLFSVVHPSLVPLSPLFFAFHNSSEARLLNFRLYSSISGAKVSSEFQPKVGLIKDYEDPELTTIKLPNGQQITLSLDFIEWFRGFTDAEGCFFFLNSSRSNYRFKYSICLHVDDVAPLEYIKNTLQIGRVNIYPKHNMATFNISSRKEIEIILAIFSKYSLNTTKHLNFLAFKQAFTIYMENNEDRDTVKPIIDSIKDNMNKLRTDYGMPNNHQVLVTEGWLLGFTEGDGSFHYSISKEMFTFSLGQKDNEALMYNIKDFLDSIAIQQSSGTVDRKTVNIYSTKPGFLSLVVKDLNFIESTIIPLFDKLTWHTKKELDYEDWKDIIELRKNGVHYLPEGEALIIRIARQMNKHRLSNSDAPRIDRTLLKAEIYKLLSEPSNYVSKNGKAWIISLNRFKLDTKAKAVQLVEMSSGNVLKIFKTQTDCADFFNISETAIRKRLKKETQFEFKGLAVYLRRVNSN